MPDALTLLATDIAVHTPTTRLVHLALGDAPFTFRAGQGVAIGLHGQPERQAYSIACAPDDTRQRGTLEFLLRADASGRLGRHLDGLGPGARVDVEGPFGSFTLPDELPAAPLVFIGGGTGIAPLRSMMRDARRRNHAAPMDLMYSVRTHDDVAYADEWTAWQRDGLGTVTVAITRPPGRVVTDVSRRLDAAALVPIAKRRPGALYLLCGPPGFVDGLVHVLSHLGVRADQIRREAW